VQICVHPTDALYRKILMSWSRSAGTSRDDSATDLALLIGHTTIVLSSSKSFCHLKSPLRRLRGGSLEEEAPLVKRLIELMSQWIPTKKLEVGIENI